MHISMRDAEGERPFSYINMIGRLSRGERFEPAQYCDSITAEEKEVVSAMLDDINSFVGEMLTRR